MSQELLIDEMIRLEHHLLKKEVRTSHEQLEQLLTDDFVEFTSRGTRYTKVDAYEKLAHEVYPDFHNQDFELRQLSANVVQLIYRAAITLKGRTRYSLRCSTWVKLNDKWQMSFHQGTPCDPFTLSCNLTSK